jgi:predicted nuclease with TOPRIM domain
MSDTDKDIADRLNERTARRVNISEEARIRKEHGMQHSRIKRLEAENERLRQECADRADCEQDLSRQLLDEQSTGERLRQELGTSQAFEAKLTVRNQELLDVLYGAPLEDVFITPEWKAQVLAVLNGETPATTMKAQRDRVLEMLKRVAVWVEQESDQGGAEPFRRIASDVVELLDREYSGWRT